MEKGLVSVVIPNYNYTRYLREAIDSALVQTYTNSEIIVVDDGSTDGSRDIIESYGERITPVFQQNRGVSAARNNGVGISKGEFIAFLDADDVWLPAKIEVQIAQAATAENLGLIHVGVEEIDENGTVLRQAADGMEGMVADDLLRFNEPVILGGGSGILVSRKIFDEVGGFDEQLSTSADWDLFYRISCRYSTAFVPETLLQYRVHSSNMHGNIKRMEREMLRGFEKAFVENTTANRRECYGNLHRTLAGSYFRSGEYGDFARNVMKSLVNRPSNLGYFLQYPLRRLRRSR